MVPEFTLSVAFGRLLMNG